VSADSKSPRKLRTMRTVRFGPEGACFEQEAELHADGWYRWPGARPGRGHRVELRQGALSLPWPASFEDETEPRLRVPARLRGHGDLLLVDRETRAGTEPLDRVRIEGERLEHRPGQRLMQTSGLDWEARHVFVELAEADDDERGIALAAQAERSEVSLPPWRPEEGQWEAVPPRDLGPLRIRSGEPIWVELGTPRRRPTQTRWVWRPESGLHPELQAIETGLPPGRAVELLIDGRRRGEQRVGPSGALTLAQMPTVDVEARTEAGAEAETVHHLLEVHNRGPSAVGFDWRVPLDPENAAGVVALSRDAEWDEEGLRIPVWAPAGRRVEAEFSTRRIAGASSPWTPTKS